MAPSRVLLTWIARNNDSSIGGPTLTLLFDPESRWRGTFRHVVLFWRRGTGDSDTEHRILTELRAEIGRRDRALQVSDQPWDGEDPTDHLAIQGFLQQVLPGIRQQFARDELVIHLSPGTPSMQTVWVLLAATGWLQGPLRLVKSYRAAERNGREPCVEVPLQYDTALRILREQRPLATHADEGPAAWDRGLLRSERMRRLFDEAGRIAPLNVPVLLLGERGVGKTTIASWIRLNSPWRDPALDAAWPSVACGQYSPETMRAELFGHEKGAFTGADQARTGLLRRAHGDTLFLDEIGDVGRDLQRLLIRALEEGRFEPLGGKPVESRFRLITATNLPWAALADRLDADFLDRISPIVLELPPLRDVPEELEWLWPRVYDHAWRRALGDTTIRRLPPEQTAHLRARLAYHRLPGNLRDLYRVAWRVAATLHAGGTPEEALADAERTLVEASVRARSPSPDLRPAMDAPEPETSSAALAMAFAGGRPLRGVVQRFGPVDPDRALDDFKAWFAEQVFAAPPAERPSLTPAKERTLRNWKK